MVKVNETHYKLIVAFHENKYLKKTTVVSAVTPGDYRYKKDFYRMEEHGCRILSIKYSYGGAYREIRPPHAIS
uniref:Uncharacterized protein n=1 Tax=Geoglobus ahangari TaxID=113653 RepID=A0A7C3UIP8_9EURY